MIELEIEQGSIEWHHERAGRVTGTRLQSALGAKFALRTSKWSLGDEKIQTTLMYGLIAERMTEVQIIELNTAAVERGREQEPFAIIAAAKHSGEDYQPCGMLISEEYQEFGFSPDAVTKENGIVIGGLETKCPSSKKHIEYLMLNEVPKEYFWQVMSPFICGDSVQWWDFASYDDRNYECPLFYIRVLRSDVEEYISVAKAVLSQYLLKVRGKHEDLVF